MAPGGLLIPSTALSYGSRSRDSCGSERARARNPAVNCNPPDARASSPRGGGRGAGWGRRARARPYRTARRRCWAPVPRSRTRPGRGRSPPARFCAARGVPRGPRLMGRSRVGSYKARLSSCRPAFGSPRAQQDAAARRRLGPSARQRGRRPPDSLETFVEQHDAWLGGPSHDGRTAEPDAVVEAHELSSFAPNAFYRRRRERRMERARAREVDGGLERARWLGCRALSWRAETERGAESTGMLR